MILMVIHSFCVDEFYNVWLYMKLILYRSLGFLLDIWAVILSKSLCLSIKKQVWSIHSLGYKEKPAQYIGDHLNTVEDDKTLG